MPAARRRGRVRPCDRRRAGLINGLLTPAPASASSSRWRPAAFTGINFGISQAQPVLRPSGKREGDRQRRVRAGAGAAAAGRHRRISRGVDTGTAAEWAADPRGRRQRLGRGDVRHRGVERRRHHPRAVRHARRGHGMMAVAGLQLGQPTIGDDWLIPSFAAPGDRRCRAERRPCQRRRHRLRCHAGGADTNSARATSSKRKKSISRHSRSTRRTPARSSALRAFTRRPASITRPSYSSKRRIN